MEFTDTGAGAVEGEPELRGEDLRGEDTQAKQYDLLKRKCEEYEEVMALYH